MFPLQLKNSPRSRPISGRGALNRKGEWNSRVVPPFPETPEFSVHSRETCFPCTASTFKPRIDSHHSGTRDSPVGKPRWKASWESLEGKPQIPSSPRREVRHCCYSSRGKRTAGPHSRRRLTPMGRLQKYPRSMSAMERNPQVVAPTPRKVLGPGIDGRGIPRGPRATRMGTGLS